MNKTTLLERATIFLSHHKNGKKPEELGYTEAVEFSYTTMSNKVKGIIFAPSKEIANAYITNQKILWKIARWSIYGGFLGMAYIIFSVWLSDIYGISILSLLIPLLIVLFFVLFSIPYLRKKLKRNEEMTERKIFVYTE